MLVNPSVFDGSTQRPTAQGDVPNNAEIQNAIANAAGVTWSAANVVGTLLLRSGAAGVSDTTPDSSTWINGLLANAYLGSGANTSLGVQVGTTYRLRVISTNTGTLTIVAGTGVTLAGVTTIVTVFCRDYLVTVLNGTPPQTFAVTTTNASAVITGMSAAQTSLLTPGMGVSGTGIQAGSTILSVQPGVGVTLSLTTTATGSLVAVAFIPRIEFRGLGTFGN